MDDKTNTKPDAPDWPSTVRTRDELDSALEAGERSGVFKSTIDEIVKKGIASAKNG